jgi:hypothetical protein
MGSHPEVAGRGEEERGEDSRRGGDTGVRGRTHHRISPGRWAIPASSAPESEPSGEVSVPVKRS